MEALLKSKHQHHYHLLLNLPDSPVPHKSDHLVPGVSVQGKAVHLQPELHNPGPPVSDGAVAVQVVTGGDGDGEVLVNVLLRLQPFGPGRAELGDG